MTTEELTELVKRTLYEVAPDLKGEPMDSNLRWNDQFEFEFLDGFPELHHRLAPCDRTGTP